MSYTFHELSQTGSGGGADLLNVYVFGTGNVPDSYLDKVYEYIDDALGQIYGNTDIPAVEVRKYSTTDTLYCGDIDSSGRSWLGANDFWGNANYLMLNSCNTNPASFADSVGGWGSDRCFSTVSSVTTNNEHEAGIVAVQEALHPYIDYTCKYVSDLVDGTNEHALGEVFRRNYVDWVTPMLHSYQGYSWAGSGDCGRITQPNGSKNDLTDCTFEALEYSRYHRKQHFHDY